MNRQLIVRPEAEADIADAAVWYDSREPGLGLALLTPGRNKRWPAGPSPRAVRCHCEPARHRSHYRMISENGYRRVGEREGIDPD